MWETLDVKEALAVITLWPPRLQLSDFGSLSLLRCGSGPRLGRRGSGYRGQQSRPRPGGLPEWGAWGSRAWREGAGDWLSLFSTRLCLSLPQHVVPGPSCSCSFWASPVDTLALCLCHFLDWNLRLDSPRPWPHLPILGLQWWLCVFPFHGAPAPHKKEGSTC